MYIHIYTYIYIFVYICIYIYITHICAHSAQHIVFFLCFSGLDATNLDNKLGSTSTCPRFISYQPIILVLWANYMMQTFW